jgi:ABC-type anion transport system, duplicated permease component
MALQDIRAPASGAGAAAQRLGRGGAVLVIGAMVLIVYGGEQTVAPLSTLDVNPVSLDPVNLPLYALRTTMRMLLAIVCSIIFTFIYARLPPRAGAPRWC